ncbi:MAG: DUF2284 domain-containing protein [Candidatus Omnitrophica bacterium]|nr:DUF2284 domain-containing protein [Candidatus Omnitrophota bacterium]
MHIKKVPVVSLEIKAYTRLQCMLGCLHYKCNPMCPPSCLDTARTKELINSYEYANIYFDNIEFDNKFDLAQKRKAFQVKLLEEECRLKSEGNFYALCFFSGACLMCDDDICNLNECKRPSAGRMAVCATGIDIMKLCESVLKLPEGQSISYWKPLFAKSHFKEFNDRYLCLGLIFY